MNKNHAARKQHTLTISNTQSVTAETAVGATIDSAMMVESPQNILVLTHYDDKMLHYQGNLSVFMSQWLLKMFSRKDPFCRLSDSANIDCGK